MNQQNIKVIPPFIFLEAKDLKAFFPQKSLDGLRRINTKFKKYLGRPNNEKLTVYDMPYCMPVDFIDAVEMLSQHLNL